MRQAEEKALRDLVADGTISATQAEAVCSALTTATAGSPVTARVRLAEVIGYVGGALLLAGASLVVGTAWDTLTRAGRVGLISAVAVGLALAGLLAGGGPIALRERAAGTASPRGRIVGVLFGLAAVTSALAGGVAVDNHSTLVAGAIGTLVAVAAYWMVPAVPELLAAGVLSATGVLGLVEVVGSTPLRMGVALLGLGVLWAVLTGLRVVSHPAVGLAVAVVIDLVGAQLPMADAGTIWISYTVTLVLAVVCFGLYLLNRTTVVLAGGVVAVTLAVPEAVWHWSGGTIDAAVLVLLAGAVLLVAGGLGLHLHRRPHATM